jgi:hypothetical protein
MVIETEARLRDGQNLDGWSVDAQPDDIETNHARCALAYVVLPIGPKLNCAVRPEQIGITKSGGTTDGKSDRYRR